jgi:hypothetical protein
VDAQETRRETGKLNALEKPNQYDGGFVSQIPKAGCGPPAHWQNGKIVIRWLASAFIRTEKRFNKIMGYRDLWTLEATLNDAQPANERFCRVVSSIQPPLETFNCAWDTLTLPV